MIKEKYKVIDAHCHVYPDSLALKATEATCEFYRFGHFGSGTVSEILTLSDKFGVDMFLIESVATTGHQVRAINDFIASAVAAHPQQLAGLGTLHVDAEDLEAEVKHLKALGLRGIKLHPDIQKVAVDDPRCLPFYELCRDYDVPILMHTGDTRYSYSNPEQVLPIVKAFPTVQFILAHLGGWSIWEDAYKYYVNLPNVYTDCSSTLAHITPETARKIIRAYGAERVLFGDDYPLVSPGPEIDRLLKMGLTEKELTAIFSKNAAALFKLHV